MERVAGVAQLGSNRAADATSKSELEVLRPSARSEASSETSKLKCVFFTVDHAVGEHVAGKIISDMLDYISFRASIFHTTHHFVW